MNLLYISDSYKNEGVFDSQVHSLCEEHAKHINVKLLVFSERRHLPLVHIPSNYCFYKSLKFSRPIFRIIVYLNVIMCNRRDLFEWADVIHCRGSISACYGLMFLRKYNIRKPIIADIRGIMTDEIANSETPLRNWYVSAANDLEMFVSNKIDTFFFVSNRMREYYLTKFNNPNLQRSALVFPTVVREDLFFIDEETRHKVRNEFNLNSNRIVVVYSGGLQKWQKFDIIARAFVKASLANKQLYLLVLTKDVEQAKTILMDCGAENSQYSVRSVPYNQVGAYLQAGDYGLLIRENNLTNQLSSPTKFGEYLCCGLTVIATAVESDYTAFLRENNNGIILDKLEDLEACLKSLKPRSFLEGMDVHGITGIARNQREVYRRLSAGGHE